MTELVTTRHNSSSEELKPCPFCGNADKDLLSALWDDDYIGPLQWAVFCHRCSTNDPRCKSEAIAIENWNRRTSE